MFVGRTRQWCMTVIRRWTGHRGFVTTVMLPNAEVEIAFLPRVGYRLLRWRPRDADGRPWGSWLNVEGGSAVEKKRLKDMTAAETMSASGISKWLGRWSNLLAHCCVAKYSDGSVRKPGWITISTYGSEWTVVAKDPDAAAQLRVRAVTVDEALQVLNELMGSEDTLWEPDPYLSSPRKRKGK